MKRANRVDSVPVVVDRDRTSPMWRQLAIGLRAAIADGRLRAGTRLPSTRQLARRLGLSRNTVMAAYEDVASRGLLRGRVGAGSFVERAQSGPPVVRWFRDDSGNLLSLAELP